MSKLTPLLLTIAGLAFAGLLHVNAGQRHDLDLQALKLSSSQNEVTAAKGEAQAAKEENQQLRTQLTDVVAKAATNDRAQAQLRADLQRVESKLGARFSLIEGRLNDSPESRAWADTSLPLPVARLRQRPELFGAEAYRRWLSPGGAVPSAAEPAVDQRGTAD